MLKLFVLIVVVQSVYGQPVEIQTSGTACEARISIYPVDIRDNALRQDQQARFEVRVCSPGEYQRLQVLGFSKHSSRPALVVNTNSSWIELAIHRGTVLLLQLVGGTVSKVVILRFKNGKPALVANDQTIGGISYEEENESSGQYLKVKIPQKGVADAGVPTGFIRRPPHVYRLRTDE